MIINLISFTRTSVKTELDRFYKLLSNSSDSFESISKSAFTQARRKLRPEAFKELTESQLSYFKENAPYQKNWIGKRVIAIDGSKLNLPYSDELAAHYGFTKNQYEIQMVSALCSFAYDVCNDLVIDSSIVAANGCEKELAVDHLKNLAPQTDILVFDRGYPAFWFMALLLQKGFKFCFRLSTAWKDGVKLANSDVNDIDWTCVLKKTRDLGKLKHYNIPKQLSGLRLVAISLPTGEKEILATNLTDRSLFPFEKLKELYHLRWGVEEKYKTFKQVSNIEYFTGRTVRAVEQDFYARIFMLNMASMVSTQGLQDQKVHRGQKNKYLVKPNKTQVLAKTKDFIIDLFYKDKIQQFLTNMLKLLNKCFDIVRPNRSFKRRRSSQRRHKFSNMKGI